MLCCPPYHKYLGVRKSDEVYTASLFITLKDHDNESLLHHVVKSQMQCVKEQAGKEDIDLDAIVLKEGTYYSSKTLTSLYLAKSMDAKIAAELREAIKSLETFISIKFIDENCRFAKNSSSLSCCVERT